MPKKIVLAYSGGLDTSVIMRWLAETYHPAVTPFPGVNVYRIASIHGLGRINSAFKFTCYCVDGDRIDRLC